MGYFIDLPFGERLLLFAHPVIPLCLPMFFLVMPRGREDTYLLFESVRNGYFIQLAAKLRHHDSNSRPSCNPSLLTLMPLGDTLWVTRI